MQVKTGELKNNLSKYLRLVRERGETIIVCDRDEPVASLAPIVATRADSWKRFRAEALARAKQIGVSIQIPSSAGKPRAKPSLQARLALDGRRDLDTAAMMRQRRDY